MKTDIKPHYAFRTHWHRWKARWKAWRDPFKRYCTWDGCRLVKMASRWTCLKCGREYVISIPGGKWVMPETKAKDEVWPSVGMAVKK